MVKSSQLGLYFGCLMIVIIIVQSLTWLSNHHSLVFNRAEQKQCSGHADAQPDRTRERRTREAEEARIEKSQKSKRKKHPACLLCFSSSSGEMFRMHGMSGEDCAVDPIFSLIQQHFSSQRKPLSLQEIGSMGSEENLSQQFVFFSPYLPSQLLHIMRKKLNFQCHFKTF